MHLFQMNKKVILWSNNLNKEALLKRIIKFRIKTQIQSLEKEVKLEIFIKLSIALIIIFLKKKIYILINKMLNYQVKI